MGFISKVFGGDQAMKAANTLSDAYDQAAGTYRDAERAANAKQLPFYTTGTNAINRINDMYFGDSPDYSEFYKSPGYEFRRSEGEKFARIPGMTLSGAQLKGLSRYNQNFASNEFGNYFSRLYGLAGMGQGSANTMGSNIMRTGENVGNAQVGSGNARASGYLAKGNIYGSLANNLLDIGTFAAGGGFSNGGYWGGGK